MRPLTDYERQVLDLAGQGLNAHDIAHRYGQDVAKVRNAIARIRRALGARNLDHAIQIYKTSPNTSS